MPFGTQNHIIKFHTNILSPRGPPSPSKIFGRSLVFEKKIGVERCVAHGWKGIDEWSNFKKTCYGLVSTVTELWQENVKNWVIL